MLIYFSERGVLATEPAVPVSTLQTKEGTDIEHSHTTENC